MPQVEITRKQIIVVDHSEIDQYGNLIVTDKEGEPHKISAKRSQLGEFIIPGRAVEFQFAEYMNKEYIANAVLVETPIPQPTPTKYPDKPSDAPESKSTPSKEVKYTSDTRSQEIETNMWWKIVSDCLGNGVIDRKSTVGGIIERVFKVKMMQVLGIEVEKKQD
jgi:hypothetical protein